ncbi:retron St85 family RNA-directed DNA polymerase [Billgrantia gudaonensis]|uniref:RNA-directed DNA polymerase n=1 Tax=Billgrantia gudaonensis TaxID=376427 RepID=A0A1G8YLB1_9GAMM|nr:retron St85 family RNA-directed DNA polymerase [Halomonas gudaonensis]SDK03526.1 Reverse transcriptase (RNA-dependent DNA polymerase) [Halomonas gudaonensis]
MGIIKSIAKELGMPEPVFREQLNTAAGKIKHIRIPKKSQKGYRKLVIPPWEFKIVQYWLIYNHLKGFPIHPSSTAYKPGASIRKNALKHAEGKYFVKMDLSDFFPSIGAEEFRNIIEEYYPKHNWLIKELEDSDFVSSIFYDKKCAIGYPASPYISNIIMFGVDQHIDRALQDKQQTFGNYSYTRYADDITISIENKGHKKEVVRLVHDSIKKSGIKNLKVNQNKTKYGSKKGGSAFITGMRICPDGHITLHRKYKDNVRLLLSLYNRGKLDVAERSKLAGHLNYCKDADPLFYNKLALKYFSSIKKLQES